MTTPFGKPFIDTNNGGSGVEYPDTVLGAADGITGVDTVIPGHREISSWADFREFGEFNRDFLAAVRRGMAEGKSAQETTDSLNLPARYADYQLQVGQIASAAANVEAIYAELNAEQ